MQRQRDMVPPVLKLCHASVYHTFLSAPCCEGRGRRWKRVREMGGTVGWKWNWVRLIVACRGKPLGSPNIIIRFSIRFQPSGSVYRQCCCLLLPILAAPGAMCFFAIQSGYKAMRKPLLIAWIPEQIISPANIGGWAALRQRGCWRLRDLYVCCCLNDYTMIATHCSLLFCVYAVV